MVKLLTVEQIAQILGKAKKTIYRYLEEGFIEDAFKIGGTWHIDESDLCDWVRRQKNNYELVKSAR